MTNEEHGEKCDCEDCKEVRYGEARLEDHMEERNTIRYQIMMEVLAFLATTKKVFLTTNETNQLESIIHQKYAPSQLNMREAYD